MQNKKIRGKQRGNANSHSSGTCNNETGTLCTNRMAYSVTQRKWNMQRFRME